MFSFRKRWTPREADEWTPEDFWAVFFSSLSYFFLAVGSALVFLIPLWGGACLVVGLVTGWIMYRIIDPKLRMVSSEYETRQKEYIRQLERNIKWEDD